MIRRFETFTSEIAAMQRCIQKIKSAEMTEFGLKGGHVMCLFYLYRHPEGLTAAELSALCEEDKAAISRAVVDLEERKFVFCQQSGEKKKYRAKLFLTRGGTEVAVRVNQRVENAVERGGAGLSGQERTIFYNSLGKIADNLQKYCEEKEE